MRQADKNRADKAYNLLVQAEKKLRSIKWENMDGRASYLHKQALIQFQALRWALTDFMNADKPE